MTLTDGPQGCSLVRFDSLEEAHVMLVRGSYPSLSVEDLVMDIRILELRVLETALLKLARARRVFGMDLVRHVEDHWVCVYSSVDSVDFH